MKREPASAEPGRETQTEVSLSPMQVALEQARKAALRGEVPVGAVVTLEDNVVAADHNRTIELNDPTAHAEILVLRRAAQILGNYRLSGVRLYVTLEPCPMCVGATIWARIEKLFFGAYDAKAGAVVSRVSLLRPRLFNHTVTWQGGVLEEECKSLLQDFFRSRRV